MAESLARVIELPVHRFVCTLCSYELPHESVPPRAHEQGLPHDFACPVCGVGKEWFVEV